MFGGGFWGVPIGNDDHLTRERDPPPRPIDLEFPEYIPPFKPHPLTSELSSRIQHRICHSKTFLDISDGDMELLNICFQKNVPLSSLVPDIDFTSRPMIFDDDLQAMLDEVGVENEDAFREVLRQVPLKGRNKPRLAYARNFFGSLEDMARYFDDSKDEYYTIPINSHTRRRGSKVNIFSSSSDKDVEMRDAATKSSTEDESGMKEVYKGYRISSAESLSPGTRIAMLKNLLKTTMHRFQCRDHEPIPQPREKLIIRGIRIQSIQYQFCVARIPQDMKLARARNVEGPVMAVAARDELRFKERTGLQTPEKLPFVGERFDLFKEIGCMLILATQRARQTTGKQDNGDNQWWINKQRWGGGPTKWGQLASEIYEDEDPSWSPQEKLLQEEKRRRQAEDKTKDIVDPKNLGVDDLIAGNGNTESTKATALPGIRAGAVSPTTVLPSDLDVRPKKKKMRSVERPPGDDALTRDGRRLMYVPSFKQKWYQDWQKLRPNGITIDEKIISKKIGTDNNEFDEVFMLTSVNHHVALVRMKVHPDYLRWLETGEAVSEEETDRLKKNVLYVSRSTWFDMFKAEARKEFLIGLWGVFSWINRDFVPQEELDKIKTKREYPTGRRNSEWRQSLRAIIDHTTIPSSTKS